MKKIIILKHGGGELANQVWNYASIYAYCLERKTECENHSFFEYAHFFNIPPIRNKVLYSLFFAPFRNYVGRRNTLRTRFFRNLYKAYVLLVHIAKRSAIISSINSANKPYYLPPTKTEEQLLAAEKNNKVLYFEGWLFRNPEGMAKYRNEIVRYFVPNETIRNNVSRVIDPLRKKFSYIAGVHIRQGDYATFKGGQYYLKASRVFEVLSEYLKKYGLLAEHTVFIIASDGQVNTVDFPGLNIVRANGNASEDLFTLAATDIVIGSDSSFGNLAAYLGNIPHVVITKEPIDWPYYREKTTYFPTKYCTMVHY